MYTKYVMESKGQIINNLNNLSVTHLYTHLKRINYKSLTIKELNLLSQRVGVEANKNKMVTYYRVLSALSDLVSLKIQQII